MVEGFGFTFSRMISQGRFFNWRAGIRPRKRAWTADWDSQLRESDNLKRNQLV